MLKNYEKPSFVERIIAVLTYLSMGFVGFIYLLIMWFRRSSFPKYLQFNIFQSIFLSLTYVLICYTLGFLLNILSLIPFINVLTAQIVMFFNAPYIFGFSIIQTFIYVLMFYLAGVSAIGKLPRVPWVSDIISYNVR